MWDDYDWLTDFFGDDPLDVIDFSELPEYQPLMLEGLSLGPDLNLPDILDDWLPSLGGGLNLGGGGKGGKGPGGLLGGGLGDILPFLAMLGGGLNANNATKGASEEIKNAAKEANEFAVTTLGGARDDFKPYMTAGTDSLAGIQALLGQPGQKFTPIKSKQMSPLRGSMTLADLAARK